MTTLPVPTRARRVLGALALTAVAALGTACAGSTTAPADHSTHPAPSAAPEHGEHGGMSGMHAMAGGDGLAAESAGFRFAPAATTLPAAAPVAFGFRILAADGRPLTTFEPDQTKLMHFYLVRDDLTGFQHVHPDMAADGTWTAPLAPAQPGRYRAYTSFVAKDGAGAAVPLVLGQELTVPGTATPTPLAAPSTTAEVDGYTLTLGGGPLRAGTDSPLSVTVSRDGRPVADLQPYLDTYAHLTALREGDLAFAHLHPAGAVHGAGGGPTLSFAANLPQPGNWRLFLQFQTGGQVHTAAVTITAGG